MMTQITNSYHNFSKHLLKENILAIRSDFSFYTFKKCNKPEKDWNKAKKDKKVIFILHGVNYGCSHEFLDILHKRDKKLAIKLYIAPNNVKYILKILIENNLYAHHEFFSKKDIVITNMINNKVCYFCERDEEKVK